METRSKALQRATCNMKTLPSRRLALETDINTLKRLTASEKNILPKKVAKSCGFKTPVNRKKSVFKPKARLSTLAGWIRSFTKYSPSKETTVSPLKASQVNLQRVVLSAEDLNIDVATWVVNMSEQFYYDNSLLLLNSAKSDKTLMVNMIRRNYKNVDVDFFNNLVDIKFLGKGSFGSVYSATDEATNKTYAIKYIAPKDEDMLTHCEEILDYMSERNSVIRAMNSPFVTNFYYSLQLKNIGGLFLFFEYCIGDLATYIDKIAYDYPDEISKRISKHEKDIIQNLDQDIRVLDVSLMYMFELFCGLDFLVKANIIHQDIKPENLMVSQTLHLKIGDFGLIYRMRTIHRNTNSELVKHDKIDTVESTNYDVGADGTTDYMDIEWLLMQMEEHENPLFMKVIENEKMFDTPNLRYDEEILIPTFLMDTWAAGIICIQLLFRGFHIFDPEMMDPDVLPGLPRSSVNEFAAHVVCRKSIFQNFVHDGLLLAGGHRLKELMEFLISIFRPRKVRSTRYTKTKIIYQLTRKVSHRYIDMDKIEKIRSFKMRNFTTKNIITYEVPENIRFYFEKTDKRQFSSFKEMIDDYSKKDKGKRLIELQPGLSINYFH